MTPDELEKLLGTVGDALGLAARTAVAAPFELLMKAIWTTSLAILRVAFALVDTFSAFTVSTTDGPVGVLWPLMLWISGILALGLFFTQITAAMLRGGRGFTRLLVGPLQYGIALAATVGMVAVALSAADGLTEGILDYGLRVDRFDEALKLTGLTDTLTESVQAVALGLGGLFGVIPAALGFVVEMLFREAAIYILVATIPLTAAGLLYSSTTVWFWRGLRWTVVVLVMKPALALTLVVGVAVGGSAEGLSGLLAGIGVLLVSLCVPLVLFKLFAFIDPSTDPGAALRDQASRAGLDSYGADSPAGTLGTHALGKLGGKGTATSKDSGDDENGDEQQEQANTDRFDSALNDPDTTDTTDGSDDDTDDTGDEDNAGGSDGGDTSTDSDDVDDTGADPGPVDDAADDVTPADPPSGPADALEDDDGDDDPGPGDPPGGGGSPPTPPVPGDGPTTTTGGGGVSDAEIEDAAVAL
ncbi:hypothetical protein [Amycolatopsis sp. H20-H5]|uniref:hypothetical protein n=1 Tax=Amycolatopsis sp. H20-H5 TaxID=3046309 RepID=UPI002DB8FA2F|nr:hypothetical protein [Amycolatopsis sp. H20-H5]MEC3981985.1 hypothetical protein [Amycolatopsis sp. H20-H5]